MAPQASGFRLSTNATLLAASMLAVAAASAQDAWDYALANALFWIQCSVKDNFSRTFGGKLT